jgi:hypothetical protein
LNSFYVKLCIIFLANYTTKLLTHTIIVILSTPLHWLSSLRPSAQKMESNSFYQEYN